MKRAPPRSPRTATLFPYKTLFRSAVPKARRKAIEAQDTQMTFGDPRRRISEETHAPRLQIGEAAEPVVDRPRREIGVERVDREIAPRRIVAPVVGKGDRRAAPVGGDVAAQGRDLVPVAAGDRGDGAVRDAGR